MSLIAFTSGAAAGLAVDLTLYPVDTIKTRLQSQQGFTATGGLKRLYAGIGPVLLGSAPGAAVFFATYETSKKLASHYNVNPVYSNMIAASLGEVMACTVRVPVEVIKQRTQTSKGQQKSFSVLKSCLRNEGFLGLFRGYRSTVIREIPFSFVQFPIWEELKNRVKAYKNSTTLTPFEGGLCGFFAGGFSAAVTTPLDVAKTRIMLAKKEDPAASGKVMQVLLRCVRNEGLSSIFSGILPRTVIISFGGFIFLGTYEQVKKILENES